MKKAILKKLMILFFTFGALFLIGNNVLAMDQSLPPGQGGGSVSCKCGLLWGKGCKADNHGATCTTTTEHCYTLDANCSK